MAEIIHAFGRKDGDPLPNTDEPKIEVDEISITMLEQMIEWCKEGKLRNIGIIGVHTSGAMSTFNPYEGNTADIAILNLAADALKDQIRAFAARSTSREHIDLSGDDDEDELGDD